MVGMQLRSIGVSLIDSNATCLSQYRKHSWAPVPLSIPTFNFYASYQFFMYIFTWYKSGSQHFGCLVYRQGSDIV